MRAGRLGAADRDAGQRSAVPGMPIEKPRLGLGRDDVRDEAPAGRQAGPCQGQQPRRADPAADKDRMRWRQVLQRLG